MTKNFRLPVLILLVFSITGLFAQIKIKELPVSEFKSINSDFISNTSTRTTELLNLGWKVFLPDTEEEKAVITVPSTFEGQKELIFQKDLTFSAEQIKNYHYRLFFLGINYSAEIYLNGQVLFKSPDGNIPFVVNIPADALTSDEVNKLSVKVLYSLDAEKTIPLKQTFQGQVSTGGIFREVFIQTLPKVNVSKNETRVFLQNDLASAELKTKIQIENYLSPEMGVDNFHLKISVRDQSGTLISQSANIPFSFNNKEEISVEQNIAIDKPQLWTPDSPVYYELQTELFVDNKLTDISLSKTAVFNITSDENNVSLNSKIFNFNGVTYFPVFEEKGNLVDYDRLYKDLVEIKNAGFNTVRFAKNVPHISALEICREIGLFTFIEIPVNSVPEEIAEDPLFNERVGRYIDYFLDAFRNPYSVAAIGTGSGYIPGSVSHDQLISKIADHLKSKTNIPVYASFISFPFRKLNNVDFYGIELYNKNIANHTAEFEKSVNALDKGRVFVSEATYPTFKGSTNGYKNRNSLEAQAKYYEDLINFSQSNKLPGFIVNTMFDYRGEFMPLSAGYNETKIIRTGIVEEDRSNQKLAYNVIRAKLSKEEKITIPMGYEKDDAPLFFILFGLGLAILLALLFNSKRKFREEATRALLRPYNFYADIRDQRILSGFHSSFLMIILASSMALLTVNVLFFLRDNIFFEKLLLSFGSHKFISMMSYICWNPLNSLFYIFIFSMLLIFGISLSVRAASFFVKTRVLFSSVYYTVTWAFLPFALIMPLELVLYRILSADVINIYLYILLGFFTLWVIQRILKGIYVIFDINASQVYLYSFILLLLVFGGLFFYFQITESTFYYLVNAYNHFTLM